MFLNNRGNALRGAGRLQDAMDSYERAIEVAPDYAEAHSNRGNVLQALKRVPEALACYDRALELSPDYADAHCNRGTALEALWRLEEALTSYDRALRISPTTPRPTTTAAAHCSILGGTPRRWPAMTMRWH